MLLERGVRMGMLAVHRYTEVRRAVAAKDRPRRYERLLCFDLSFVVAARCISALRYGSAATWCRSKPLQLNCLARKSGFLFIG